MESICGNLDNSLAHTVCEATVKWANKGLDYTTRFVADGVSKGQEKVLKNGARLASATDDKISAWLVGAKGVEFKTNWRLHKSFTLMTLTGLCFGKAMKNLGLSWKYLPIPIFRSKKIVTITSVKLPGDDVAVDKVREDQRALDKSVKNLFSAALWAAGSAFGTLGILGQIYQARAEQNVQEI